MPEIRHIKYSDTVVKGAKGAWATAIMCFVTAVDFGPRQLVNERRGT